MLTIVDPKTLVPFLSTIALGRQCFALEYGQAFALRITAPGTFRAGRHEVVLSVDGRDVLTNQPSSPDLGGVVFSGEYVCRGFQVSAQEARPFVFVQGGQGLTTAERNGTESRCGVVAAALYDEDHHARPDYARPVMRGGDDRPTRGVTRGSGGAMAGHTPVSAPLTVMGGPTFHRNARSLVAAIVEYDTLESWARRGVTFQRIHTGNPWGQPGTFSPPDSL